MIEGRLIAIHIVSQPGAAAAAVDAVTAVAGDGLTGDRFYRDKGAEAKRQVTLIESETIEAVGRDYDLDLSAAQSRRNLLTRGVALNHLVGCTFTVGEVELRGVELCEPCGHLEQLTLPGVRQALTHRGGLRAEILRGGTLRVGDVIRPSDSHEQTP